MPRGAGPKREREYRKLKGEFKRSGRYRGREEEVASRIVNKQRAMYGETRGARRQKSQGRTPDRGLPIQDYRSMTVPQIRSRLGRLSGTQLRRIQRYEKEHKDRTSLLREIDRRLKAA